MQMIHQVKLENFSGPLDLLLHLVRKNELDISTVSIAAIVDQYLASLTNIASIDIDDAAEFLAMAATLMRIKARHLLPENDRENHSNLESSELEEELVVERLLEYRRYNAVAEVLASWQEQQIEYFTRGFCESFDSDSISVEDSLGGVSLLSLALAFKAALAELAEREPAPQTIARLEVTVEEQVEFLLRHCRNCPKGLRLRPLLSSLPSKLHVVTAFLAVLEAVRRGLIIALQEQTFGHIILFPLKGAVLENEHTANT